jgi:hypothetical protein
VRQHGSRGIAISSRYQATTSEGNADWKILGVCSNKLQSVKISDNSILPVVC